MFKKLQQKWGVNGLNMALIITTFALGGSACARIAGQLLKLSSLEKNTIWWVVYILLVTILWPICVIIISFPLGQFKFFKNYLFRLRCMKKTTTTTTSTKHFSRVFFQMI